MTETSLSPVLHSPRHRAHPGCRRFVILGLLAFSSIAEAKITVKARFFANQQPVQNTLVTLYNCKTGVAEAGPFATAQDGSVLLENIEPGDHCVRAETPAGNAREEVNLTPDRQPIVELDHIDPRLTVSDRALPVAICSFTLLMVMYPILRYLAKSWAFRRDYLIGQLSGDSMKLYYEQFRAGATILQKPIGDPSLSGANYTDAFRHDFNKWYGRRYYIVPVIGLLILTAFCGWWGSVLLWDWTGGLVGSESMRRLVGAALAGAYLWIISDEIDRLRRRDFTSFDVYYYIFRVLISIPFGWALTRLAVTLQVGIPVAFFLGAFPTSTLFTLARRLANQQLKLGDDNVAGKLELESLQSVGKDAAERFRDEGIFTISQLAYADPLDLTIRTNFDFNYVVDCVSQALLWIYLGDKSKELQSYSLRGAQEVAYFYACLTATTPDPNAIAALQEIATTKLDMSKEALTCTLEQVAKDPYTIFLCEIWT
jgi:hypothetical protein